MEYDYIVDASWGGHDLQEHGAEMRDGTRKCLSGCPAFGKPETFRTLQEAVDAASNLRVNISIRPGVYVEGVALP